MNFKKPKFWGLNEPNFFSYLLFPLTFLIKINNFLLDRTRPLRNKNIKTICVGNIYLGGTGKTPTVIKLYNITKKLNFNVVTAKKFYKNEKDEQIILNEKTKLITGKTRKEIVKLAIKAKNNLIIFDDGLQDKKTFYDLKFVCFDADEWIGNGQLIPSGPLREQIDSLRKYDAVLIKNNNDKKPEKIIKLIRNIHPDIKIYFTNYVTLNLDKFDLTKKYLLFSGIGNPSSFKNLLIKNKFNIDYEMIFPDHYDYKDYDIFNILKKAENLKTKIITTKKDYVKIPNEFKDKIGYLDIDLEIQDENKLIDFLNEKLNEKY